ncbi:hypothetical protein MYSE111917_16635 [Mycobacterium senriense]|uniref:Uncharacterized protein n=1 Tax=Mycobacterium senriense TaxID=2775496 RepID=A0ABM7SWH7_9MYCO|nr:hypothetical protein [Mycobacterium senriense]BCZ24849.1 hypothetical protein MTY59_47040 [Mycobacterium senriense]
MTEQVPLDDPRRHIRIRLRAAQILVHALWSGLWPEGAELARRSALNDFGPDASAEILPAVLGLLHEYADEPLAMTSKLREEIARLHLYLADVGADGKITMPGDNTSGA